MVKISEQAFDAGALHDILAADGSSLSTPPSGTKILFPGDDGNWYEKDSAGTVTQVNGSGSSSAGGLLAAKWSTSTYTVTATSMTALDTTNLRAAFTTPASGNVLVKVGGTVSSASTSFSFHFGALDGAGIVVNGATYQPGGTAMSWIQTMELTAMVTGLSAGSHSFDAAALNSVGSKSVTLYGAWIQVWAVP